MREKGLAAHEEMRLAASQALKALQQLVVDPFRPKLIDEVVVVDGHLLRGAQARLQRGWPQLCPSDTDPEQSGICASCARLYVRSRGSVSHLNTLDDGSLHVPRGHDLLNSLGLRRPARGRDRRRLLAKRRRRKGHLSLCLRSGGEAQERRARQEMPPRSKATRNRNQGEGTNWGKGVAEPSARALARAIRSGSPKSSEERASAMASCVISLWRRRCERVRAVRGVGGGSGRSLQGRSLHAPHCQGRTFRLILALEVGEAALYGVQLALRRLVVLARPQELGLGQVALRELAAEVGRRALDGSGALRRRERGAGIVRRHYDRRASSRRRKGAIARERERPRRR